MLQSIPDRAEYLEIVETLVDEFPEEIEAGAARSVAVGVVGSLEIVGDEPAVAATASYEGAPVEAVESALNPYDILACSHQPARGTVTSNDPVAARAIRTLAADLRTEHDWQQSTTGTTSEVA